MIRLFSQGNLEVDYPLINRYLLSGKTDILLLHFDRVLSLTEIYLALSTASSFPSYPILIFDLYFHIIFVTLFWKLRCVKILLNALFSETLCSLGEIHEWKWSLECPFSCNVFRWLEKYWRNVNCSNNFSNEQHRLVFKSVMTVGLVYSRRWKCSQLNRLTRRSSETEWKKERRELLGCRLP